LSGNETCCFGEQKAYRAHHILRELRPEQAAFLLRASVQLLDRELPPLLAQEQQPPLGQDISLDTKHILAWVKENNPKTYCREGRFDKHNLPKGGPDCRLGCKRH
jgi:hypothetical protein